MSLYVVNLWEKTSHGEALARRDDSLGRGLAVGGPSILLAFGGGGEALQKALTRIVWA